MEGERLLDGLDHSCFLPGFLVRAQMQSWNGSRFLLLLLWSSSVVLSLRFPVYKSSILGQVFGLAVNIPSVHPVSKCLDLMPVLAPDSSFLLTYTSGLEAVWDGGSFIPVWVPTTYMADLDWVPSFIPAHSKLLRISRMWTTVWEPSFSMCFSLPL